MAQQAEPVIERSLRTLTETATECVATLPTVVHCYAEEDPARSDVVERVGTLESRCDEQVQSLRREIATVGPEFSDAYLFAPDLLGLAYEIDRIAGASEQFATELAAIQPRLPAAAEQSMIEHARRSTAAGDRLRRGVDAALDDEPCGEDVDAIRAAESACDRLKYEMLADANGSPGEVLVVRQFAVTLDAIPNAVEDAADRLGQLRAGGV
ncbi:hypothetical protein L593_09350 [Salinarchaeum sp. Harcht-Bsk1]|uniref:DUF47 domain-containing protein n=1 Tax=Salinarchaeum sp. Harcht-Bsk1 TaxID=1333523 RepID=UPI000342475B|nr:DUF47 family protein [Salinarchaeum sp. Harcht-Bsk1]AGN01815.1 hypothetical protein L593_09350 [Salinarchaeum sp. Harcht-Bsk1]